MSSKNKQQLLMEVQRIRQGNNANLWCADCSTEFTTYICLDYSIFICKRCADIHGKLKHNIKPTISTFNQNEVEQLRINGGNKSVNQKYLSIYSKNNKNKNNKTPYPNTVDDIERYIQQKYHRKLWYKLPNKQTSNINNKKHIPTKHRYGDMVFSGNLLSHINNNNPTACWQSNFSVLYSDKTLIIYDKTLIKSKIDLKNINYISKIPKPITYKTNKCNYFFYLSNSMTSSVGYSFGCNNKYKYLRWISNIKKIINKNKIKSHLYKNELLIDGYCRIYSNNSYFPLDILDLITLWFRGGWDLFNTHKDIEIGAYSVKRVKIPDAKIINVFSAEWVGFGQRKIWKLQLKGTDPNKKIKKSSAMIGVIDSCKVDAKMNDCFANRKNGGYAYGAWTGNIYSSNIHPAKIGYGPALNINDIIEVDLDMTGENAILSFLINGISKGAAFNDLNKTKQYKLAIALKWREHYVLIVD